jgi:Flp pilus assembly pilin Flp
MSSTTRVAGSRPRPRSLRRDERGASLVEYLLLVGLVAIVGLLGFRLFGGSVDAKIQCLAGAVAADGPVCSGDGATGAYALAAPAGAPGPGANGAGDPNPAGAAGTTGTELAATTVAAAGGDDGNPVVDFVVQVGGFFGGLGYGVWGDLTGLWDLVTNPWETVKNAGAGILDRIEGRAEADAVKVQDQLAKGDRAGAAWTLIKGAWSSTSGLAIDTLVLDEGVKEDWKNGNYGGAAGRVVWNVGSMFIPGVNGAKFLGKLGKLGKVAKAEKAADAAGDVGKKADGDETPDGDGTKKTDTDAPDIDPVTAETLARYGLTPDSVVYRTMDPKYLDEASGTVRGNPDSVALVADPYNLVENPLARYARETGQELPPGIPTHVPRQVPASEVGPGLNVARDNPAAYVEPGSVTVAVKVADILAAGGKVYPDVGAAAQGIGPIYVTFDGAVPYTRVTP